MIYLDYAAATPLSKKALTAMIPYFSEQFFNPSAAYLPAKQVRADYEAAKDQIAHCIGAKGVDLVITASATEANNLAFSVLDFTQKTPRPTINESTIRTNDTATHPRCLFLATEHDSIQNVAKNYPFDIIKVDQTGLIDLADLKAKLTTDVILVSVALVSSELGTIQPLAEISTLVRAERERRLKQGIATPLFLHSDASAAMNLLDINIARLGVDMLTLNAAKVYGPKGVGALYLSHDVKLGPTIFGGGQEQGLRSGTENVPAVIGFATAFADAKAHIASNRKKYQHLTTLLRQELSGNSIIPHFLCNIKKSLANFCPLSYPGLDAERLIYKLEAKGVYLSTGAACAARKNEKSKALVAIGLSDVEIAGSLRISLGKDNTKADIKRAATLIKQAVAEELARHA